MYLICLSKNLSIYSIYLFFLYQKVAVQDIFQVVYNKIAEAVARRCSVKRAFLGILQNSLEKTCARVSFLIKLQTLVQMLSYEFCEISKNAFSYKTPPVASFK